MDRTIKLNQYWLKPEHEEALMKRIKGIVSGPFGHGPYKKPDGYAWQLDDSNDWWAEVVQEGDGRQLRLATRYSQAKLDAAVAFIKVFLVSCWDGPSVEEAVLSRAKN